MEKLYNSNSARKNKTTGPAYGVSGTQGSPATYKYSLCPHVYDPENPTSAESLAALNTDFSCFPVGCMPGNAPAHAMCLSDGGGPGNTDTLCPTTLNHYKDWNCPVNPALTQQTNQKEYLEAGGNFLTPALSARYIKANFQTPFKNLGNNSYACLNNSTNEDTINTSVMSQSTRIRKNDDGFWYINEFRENKNNFDPQIERTFEIGDTFDYYKSIIDENNVLSGNKNFDKFYNFRVVDVDVKIIGVGQYSDKDKVLVFDYKCEKVKSYFSTKYGTDDDSLEKSFFVDNLSFYLYSGYDASTTATTQLPIKDIQIPYTIKTETLFEPRALNIGISPAAYTTQFLLPERYKNSEGLLANKTIGVSVNSSYMDYYKLNGLVPKEVEEPLYSKSPGANFVYLSGNFISRVYPTWINLFGYTSGTTIKTPCVDQPEPNYIYPYGPEESGDFGLPGPKGSIAATGSIVNSTLYSGEAIRAGMLDMLVLTSTEMETNSGLKTTVDVTVSGKPYGVAYFLSSPGTSSAMINYESFGRIESFDISSKSKSGVQKFPTGTLLKSKKGFQIKILPKPPTSYSFENIESPSGDIFPYKNNFNYSDSEIVNFKNTNLRQYFRNTSYFSIPYMKNMNIDNPLIPFSIYDSTARTWYYPVYKYPGGDKLSITIDGNTVYHVKDQLLKTTNVSENESTSTYIKYDSTSQELMEYLTSFDTVGVTAYPENNFSTYYQGSYYGAGDAVITSEDGQEVLYKSLISGNINKPLTDKKSWERDGLIQDMTSMKQNNFYGTFQQGNDFTKFIQNVKNLDNQNLPASIERDSDDFVVEEFCPRPCTLYNLSEKYENSFVKAEYFESIRYLFETPTILSKNDKSSIISLGNAPVSKAQNYNTGYLQDGGARNNFLSQYLYSIDINGQENKFNRPGCSGGLSITTKDGLEQTEVNKFDFSNSILFNFLPCDIDSQDFIKYSVNTGASSGLSVTVTALDSYGSTNTPNIFPPYGVSCNVLLSKDEGKTFHGVSGYFKYTYVISQKGNTGPLYIVNDSGNNILSFTTENTINFMEPVTNDKFNYGDIWYNSETKETQIPSDTSPFGFLIPNQDKGISTRSFMQLNRESNYTPYVNYIPSKNNEDNTNKFPNIINRFKFPDPLNSGTMVPDEVYTGVFADPTENGLSVRVLRDDSGAKNKPLTQIQAKFYPSDGTHMENIESSLTKEMSAQY